MATIINYSGNYVRLLDNVLEALYILQSTYTSPSAAFQNFRDQCQSFFLEWAYVLQQTTPWRPKWQDRTRIKKPSGFGKNETAMRMMLITERWGNGSFEGFSCHLNSAATANDDISDGDMEMALHEARFSFGGNDHLRQNSNMTVCALCSKVVDGYKMDKHLDFACKALEKDKRSSQRRNKFWGRG